MVVETDEVSDSIIFHAVNHLPDDPAEGPRFIYVPYSNNASNNVFGTYENYQSNAGSTTFVFCSAVLITDAIADGIDN